MKEFWTKSDGISTKKCYLFIYYNSYTGERKIKRTLTNVKSVLGIKTKSLNVFQSNSGDTEFSNTTLGDHQEFQSQFKLRSFKIKFTLIPSLNFSSILHLAKIKREYYIPNLFLKLDFRGGHHILFNVVTLNVSHLPSVTRSTLFL